jgi:murein L,D-transpeptidase YcbB/YkuD
MACCFSVSKWIRCRECRSRLRRRALDKLLQPLDQTWCKAKKLIAVEYGQAAQNVATLPAKGDQHASSVQWVRVSLNQSARLHAVDEANGAVVANLQPVCQVGDGSSAVRSQAPQHEQQLVVLRFKAS